MWDASRDLVPYVQFKKREKHPRRSVNFSKVAGWNVLNCVNGTKSRKASHVCRLQINFPQKSTAPSQYYKLLALTRLVNNFRLKFQSCPNRRSESVRKWIFLNVHESWRKWTLKLLNEELQICKCFCKQNFLVGWEYVIKLPNMREWTLKPSWYFSL